MSIARLGALLIALFAIACHFDPPSANLVGPGGACVADPQCTTGHCGAARVCVACVASSHCESGQRCDTATGECVVAPPAVIDPLGPEQVDGSGRTHQGRVAVVPVTTYRAGEAP